MADARKRWTREELLLALELYWRTPFGRQHSSHPPIVALAEKIGRKPGAVAMKLSNFTSLDPAEQGRVKGLKGASKLDKEIWNEFHSFPLELVDEMETVYEKKLSVKESPPEGALEALKPVMVRRAQQFFRRVVLTNYGNRCCVTGNPVPALLRASHIVPWSACEAERVNPRNGLCLNALHDTAFDRGLISFDDDNRLITSSELRERLPSDTLEMNFMKFEGRKLQPPERNIPDPKFFAYHRENVFLG